MRDFDDYDTCGYETDLPQFFDYQHETPAPHLAEEQDGSQYDYA
jgi:hypothetical protein